MTSNGRVGLPEFLSGVGPDARGRLFEDVLAFSDRELESKHDFIQWLFPLDTPSAAVPGSPVLSPSDIASIRVSEPCQGNLRRSAERLARFYAENDHWLVPYDHNHLRITRIILSLKLLVGRPEAEQFMKLILARAREAESHVSERSQRYWREALD